MRTRKSDDATITITLGCQHLGLVVNDDDDDYYISCEPQTTRNVLWSPASVCLSMCA